MAFTVLERDGVSRIIKFSKRKGPDKHLHVRDGIVTKDVVNFSAERSSSAIIMPNLLPPVTTGPLATAYRERIEASLEPKHRGHFTLEMVIYLTDNTTPEIIREAKQHGVVAAKLYPAGATTNSNSGVTDLRKIYPALAEMQKLGMLLLFHGEVTDPEVDLFDREAVFIDKKLRPLRRDFPELKMVFEHMTTKQAAQYVPTDPFMAGTATLQHLMYNRNAIFTGGLQPHWYCLPVLKSPEHQLALIEAVTSGTCKRFFRGTDSAPHASHLKEHAGGHAGCFTANADVEGYAEVFERTGALDQRFEDFMSLNGPAFYGHPPSTEIITLVRKPWTMPVDYPFGEARIKPLRGGQTVEWQIEGLEYPELEAA